MDHLHPTIADLGEDGILARIVPRLVAGGSAIVGAGDDAAVLRTSDGRYVVTCDLMVHGPDFRLAWSTPHDLGWKAAATNLTDISAMGARPTALVIAIAAPRETRLETIEGISAGVRDALAELAPGAGVVGGDLSVSATLTIAVTAFGDLEGRDPVLRSGAKMGDVIAHAGPRGAAARGLELLFAEAVDADGNPDPLLAAKLRRSSPELIAAQLSPRPPVFAGVIAAKAGATAMLDVSDGLGRDAGRIALASGVAFDFASKALGADPAVVLGGAEDHGLLATFATADQVPPMFDVLGHVVSGNGEVMLDGVITPTAGWDPYSSWDGAAG